MLTCDPQGEAMKEETVKMAFGLTREIYPSHIWVSPNCMGLFKMLEKCFTVEGLEAFERLYFPFEKSVPDELQAMAWSNLIILKVNKLAMQDGKWERGEL